MIAYNNHKLPPGLEYVGDGFIVRKTAVCTGKEAFSFMKALCKHLIAQPDPMIVPTYSFEYIGESTGIYKYQYDMMRLGNISEREKQIIWQVVDAWRAGSYDPAKHFLPHRPIGYKDYITVEQAWEAYPKLMAFLNEIIKLGRYHDLHGENIMLDNDAEYRLVDLESFNNPPLSLPENNWIIR
jgi:hypothetical protein